MPLRHCIEFANLLFAALVFAGANAAAKPSAFVDDDGILRWTESGKEIAQFGVNYTAPFAYSFRAHQRLGLPIEKAIDADTYHFARLGFDAYRVHIWDREITDEAGNLLVNEHVKALDYLVAKLKGRGIKIILTPLQFGDAGYPELDSPPLRGFSAKYNKRDSLEDRASWPLQERYLTQLLSHVNSHTGLAYKEDPDIIGFEICNEPGHFQYDLTLQYINTMAEAIRSSGCEKPIFYNMSHGIPVHQAYLDANVQGGTFQWYPTNLLAGHEQRGNFLPYVDDYPVPFAADPKFKTKAKIIYEFDAADVGRSYIYPAIARTFRQNGFQFATQFAYDPLALAPYNTEYQTHFLNLAYSPSKAIGMKVAGEAFRRVPLGHDYGKFPQNTAFAGIDVDYKKDLAELVTDTEYYYSNSTESKPPHPERLEHIAGVGSSSLISYDGTGAYFIDRLEAGVWRLEVMPDAIWVSDPFAKASPEKHVARIAWNRWPMKVALPDLPGDFDVVAINEGNKVRTTAKGSEFLVTPGVYLLSRRGQNHTWKPESHWQNIVLKEFVAPTASMDKIYVLHTPPHEVSTGEALKISATVAGPEAAESVDLFVSASRELSEALETKPADENAQPGGNNPRKAQTKMIPMEQHGLNYIAIIPPDMVREGTLRYHIVVKTAKGVTTFPSQLAERPQSWNFYGEPYRTRVANSASPVTLFEAVADFHSITADHRDVWFELTPTEKPGGTALLEAVPGLKEEPHDFSWRLFCSERIENRAHRVASAKKIVVVGRSRTATPCLVQVALVTQDGATFGGTLEIPTNSGKFAIDISALKPVRSPNIPHGYPVYIPFWSPARDKAALDLSQVESVMVSIGPGIAEQEQAEPRALEIERIYLE